MTVSAIPIVPPPRPGYIVEGALRNTMLVKLGFVTVIYNYDCSSLTLSIDSENPSLGCLHLDAAINTGTAIGRPVVIADVSCGALIDNAWQQGEVADLALIREAIPHFYAQLRNPEERKVLRTIYRTLDSLERADN